MSTYGPTFLAEIGIGAILAVLTLSALRFGASQSVATLVVAAYGLGRVGGSAWGGTASHRYGPARAAGVALACLAAGSGIAALSTALLPLATAAAVIGVGHAAFHVARQALLTDEIPATQFGRGLTTLAGVWRIANFIGPLLGAALILASGLRASYVLATAMAVVAGIVLMRSDAWQVTVRPPATVTDSMLSVARATMSTLRTLGFAVLLTGAVRAARLVILPLWCDHLGFAEHTTATIFAVSTAVDMLLFLPAGWVLDRWGRGWTAIPSTLLLGAGATLLPFTSTTLGVTLAAVLLGLGNGWGSGVLMTLGNDVAPLATRSLFLGWWAIVQDAGGLAGPAIVSAAAVVALPAALWTVGGLSVVTSLALWHWIPPWRPGGRASPAPATGSSP